MVQRTGAATAAPWIGKEVARGRFTLLRDLRTLQEVTSTGQQHPGSHCDIQINSRGLESHHIDHIPDRPKGRRKGGSGGPEDRVIQQDPLSL